jgi:hypothetical protein
MRGKVISLLKLKHEALQFTSYRDDYRWRRLAEKLGYKKNKQVSQAEFLENYDWESMTDDELADLLPLFFIYAWRQM